MLDNIPAEIGLPIAAVLWVLVVILYRRDRKNRER